MGNATVIDALIVTLGLDPKGFTEGQKTVIKGLKETKDHADETAKHVSARGKQAAEFFTGMRDEALKLFSVIAGGAGLTEFIREETKLDIVTGRSAKNLGIQVEQLSAWQGAAKRSGATAEDTTASIHGLVSGFEQLKMTGNSPLVPYLNRLGITLKDLDDPLETLVKISAQFEKMNPQQSAQFGAALGFNQGFINFLNQGPNKIRALLKEQEELFVITHKNTEASEAFDKSLLNVGDRFRGIASNILEDAQPAMTALLNSLVKITQENPESTKAFLEIAAGIIAIGSAITVAGIVGKLTGISTALTAIAATGLLPLIASIGFGYEAFKPIQNAGDPEEEKKLRALDKPKDSPYSGKIQRSGAGSFMQRAIQSFMAKGWTENQAVGMASNLLRESSGDPNATGDHGEAYGLAQWHPDRQRDFMKAIGRDIRGSSEEDQFQFVDYELRKGKKQSAGAALANTDTREQAAKVFSSQYEIPANWVNEALIRSRMASSYGVGGNTGNVSNAKTEVHIGSITVNAPKATDATGIAQGLRGALQNNLRVQQANTGLD